MSAAKKCFLAGIFFVVGGFAALVQLHPSVDSAEQNLSAFDSEKSNSLSPLLPANIVKDGNFDNTAGKKDIPPFPYPDAPYYDKGNGKFVQAYPQPVILVDASALLKEKPDGKADAEAKKMVNPANKPEPEKIVQKVPITQAEFKPLHQFASVPKDKPAEVSETVSKTELREKPNPVPSGNDDLLPVFDFAENLVPSKPKKEAELPLNPFPVIPSVMPAAAEEKTVQQTVQPQSMQPFLFQKLSPLVPQEKKEEQENKPAAETKPEVKPNNTLLRLSPLAGLMHGIHFIYR